MGCSEPPHYSDIVKAERKERLRVSLNLDPGFSWIGWSVTALVDYHVVAMGLIRTEKSDKKLNVRSASDTFQRTRLIARELNVLVQEYRPTIFTFEAFSPPRNAGVTGKLGHAYGAIATLAELLDLPCVSPTPQEVKKANRAKTKDEVAASVLKRFNTHKASNPAIRRFLNEFHSVAANHTHAWDSLGVLVAAKDSEVYRAARST